MIPTTHILLLALLQFTIGLLGLMLRRAGMVVLVSAVIMLNGVLLALSAATARTGSTLQAQGVVVILIMVAVALSGAAVLYGFSRFRRSVSVDEHDRMKH